MSVVIRGMGIPKTCGDCPCYETEEGFCRVTYDDVSCLQISKQGNCPLVELPAQHGRLIDAYELTIEILKLQKYRFSIEDSEIFVSRKAVMQAISDNPTVIEAEEVSE